MYKQVTHTLPDGRSRGSEADHGTAPENGYALEQDPGLFSFALHALSELNASGADAVSHQNELARGAATSHLSGAESLANSSKQNEEEHISSLQSALDSYKDWLSSI